MSRCGQSYHRKKSPKTSQADTKDRISKLPKCILSYILSSLPTKYAVRTCVLSKEWEYLWTSSNNVDMDDVKPVRFRNKAKFVNSVERVLFHSLYVKSFRLSCHDKYDSNRIMAWISAVLSRNVENFELSYLHDGIELPRRSLVNCTSLKKLVLKLPCIMKVPMKDCFPNLTILYLQEVEIQNTQSSTEELRLTFPILEICSLERCKWVNVNIVVLYTPLLTIFSSKPAHGAEVNEYTIKIHGSRLVNFKSSSEFLETFDMTNSPIAYATLLNNFYYSNDLQLLEKSGLQVRMLLKKLCCLKELELSGNVLKALAQSKHGLYLPSYSSLERLVIKSCWSVEALLELLHASPYLKQLDIDVSYCDDYDYDSVQNVPMCISSSLNEVKFNSLDLSSKKSGFYLAKFLLKNAMLLKKVHISSIPSYERTSQRDEIVEELSTFPNNSGRCLTIVVS